WWGEYAIEDAVKTKKPSLNDVLGRQLSGLQEANNPFLKDLGAMKLDEIRRKGSGVRTLLSRNGKPRIGLAYLNGDHSVILAVVETDAFFPVVTRIVPKKEEGIFRAYLITESGRVLAHSEPAYVGSDFSGSEIFRESIRKVFKQTETV